VKAAANITILLTVLACLAALMISVYPGVLNDLLFIAVLLAAIAVPVIGIVAVIVLIVLACQGRLKHMRLPWKLAGILFAILLCTYMLLKFYIPRRIAFAASRASFEQLLVQAPVSQYPAMPLNRWLGVYRVDAYAADSRGGVYFRVYSGNDGLGPDRMSYGFAYKPNMQGTPFGAAEYRVFSLGNGWYWFRASDDWS
jgi:hypothetical protein